MPKPAKKTAAVKPAVPTKPAWINASTAKLEKDLVTKYGEDQRERARRGLKQVAEFWRAEDGNAQAFESFVMANFAGTQKDLDTMFDRFESLYEKLAGHMHQIGREFRQHADLDRGPIMPYDEVFAAYNPSAHISDDFFQNKLAFTVLLNFPLTTLDQRLAEGQNWTRRQWAETRLAESFSKRVPAVVSQQLSEAMAKAENYIAQYNIWMHHLVDDKGTRLFPPKLRLLSHWNLRDQIKGDYADEQNGPAKQRMIQKVMERIVTQTIPASVIDNPNVDWNPFTNEVKPTTANDGEVPGKENVKPSNAAEPDTRYAMLLGTFKASRKYDEYSPTAPTLIARRFDEDRQIPEERVRKMLETVVSSPLVPKVAALIEQRLGRPLEPFDIWYNGFRPRGQFTEAQLDEIVSRRYPTPEAYRKDIPKLLEFYGWQPERAQQIAANIMVDPARGSGHAMGAAMRGDKAHLRTRVPASGMNYKGFNIAIHEMGHNVEQTISLNDVDHWLLNGVPNTAFTEAFAFVFQAKDMEQLGLPKPTEQQEAERVLNDFWGTYEIAGVALVDMQVWHWMYDHPNATPAQLKEATLQIARDTWNKYYAPVFKQKDVTLLAVYSHMVDSLLYLPDYPMGHLIAFQVEEQMREAQTSGKGSIASEFERMAKYGNVAPDLWMKNATGKPVGPEALLEATERALTQVQQARAAN
ncbi:MAG TPA: hypothetical protein VD837_14825 [Terriglobales bacterium]|nr:hypothetical protein [Terriglobales bacterium]